MARELTWRETTVFLRRAQAAGPTFGFMEMTKVRETQAGWGKGTPRGLVVGLADRGRVPAVAGDSCESIKMFSGYCKALDKHGI